MALATGRGITHDKEDSDTFAEHGLGLAFKSLGLEISGGVGCCSSAEAWPAVRDDMYDAMIADMEEFCR